MSFVLRLFALMGCLVLSACGGAGEGGGQAGPALSITVLDEGTYLGRYVYQRVRISREGVAPSYGVWFPPPGLRSGAKAPAVLLSDPYAGIDWTGEPVDIQAHQMAGTDAFVMLPDVNGPPMRDGTQLYVPYDYAPMDTAGGSALAYLANGIGVLLIHQRFYAGGDLQNDIDDTVSGLVFLNQNAQVDRRRIGAWGSSYGGSILLHAMAQASTAWRPAYAAVATPIVDFEQFVPYADWQAAVNADPGQAILRLQPFAQRARAAAARAESTTGLARYNSAALQANRDTRMLFLHDLFDTIAPLLAANTLYFGTPGQHEVFIYPHQGADLDWARLEVSHAPVKPGYDEASAVLLSQAYLLVRLRYDAQEVLLPQLGDVEAVFPYLRRQQLLGADLNTLLRPRLLELCDPKVQLVHYEDAFQTREAGREFVARMLRTHWSYDVSADRVVEFLSNHGL